MLRQKSQIFDALPARRVGWLTRRDKLSRLLSGTRGKAMSPGLVRVILLLLMSFAIPFKFYAQNDPLKDSALLPESWARKSAIIEVMPSYPDDPAQGGVAGVVRIRFETNSAGEVVKIKVKPGTDPFLKKAVIDAMKQWKFKPWLGRTGLKCRSSVGWHFNSSLGMTSLRLKCTSLNHAHLSTFVWHVPTRQD